MVVKEKNSDVNLYNYFCMVEIEGDPIDPNTYLNFTDIKVELDHLQRNSTGGILFNNPVNLTFVQENFNSLFDVYVRNNTWIKHNSTAPVKDFIITATQPDNKTMNFTVVFDEPYMMGLLVKRSDRLYLQWKWYLLDTYGFFKEEYHWLRDGIVLGNVSETRFFPDMCESDREQDA